MRLIFTFLLFSSTLFAQNKKEALAFNNSLVVPFNNVSVRILEFNKGVMTGEAFENLKIKRDLVFKALDTLDKAILNVSPITKDYGLLEALKSGSANYRSYMNENFSDQKLSVVPTTARENILQIRKAQKSAKKVEIWNADFTKRQNKLLVENGLQPSTDSTLINKTLKHKAAMNYYYELTINELKVKAFVDDFIDAMNASDKEKVGVAAAKLRKQLKVADAFVKSKSPFQKDESLLVSTKKMLAFYQKLSDGLFTDYIKFSSYPEKIPNDKVDEYNLLVEKINNGVQFLNTLQSHLNNGLVVVHKFFENHLN